VVLEWLGKCHFSNCYIRTLWMSCIDDVFCSAINAPTTGNTYAAYLAAALALGPSEPVVSCSLVPLGFPCTYYFSDDFQISSTGPMVGGVGATPVSSPVVSSSATTSRSSTSAPSTTSKSASKPSSSSSPSYLVTNDLFTILSTGYLA
jgi:hypothetical protein